MWSPYKYFYLPWLPLFLYLDYNQRLLSVCHLKPRNSMTLKILLLHVPLSHNRWVILSIFLVNHEIMNFSVKLWIFFNEFFLPEAPMAWIQFRSHRLLLSSKEGVTSEFLSYLIQACHYRVGCKRAWHFLLLSLQRRKHPNSVPVSPIGYSTIKPISFNNKISENYYG